MRGKAEPYWDVTRNGVKRREECLLYKGPIASNGYGKIYFRGKHLSSHRVSYSKWKGDISPGAVVDHECHNEAQKRGECPGGKSCWHRACVNPEHLRAVSHRENVNSGAKPRGPRRTHCPRNHEYTEDNTNVYINRRGCMQRSCLTCERDRTQRRVKNGDFRGRRTPIPRQVTTP
jgi:hypothetical protein